MITAKGRIPTIPSFVFCPVLHNTFAFVIRTTVCKYCFIDVGESSKSCRVAIVNDRNFEPDEVFYLYLGSVHSAVGGEIDQNQTEVVIRNPEDGTNCISSVYLFCFV